MHAILHRRILPCVAQTSSPGSWNRMPSSAQSGRNLMFSAAVFRCHLLCQHYHLDGSTRDRRREKLYIFHYLLQLLLHPTKKFRLQRNRPSMGAVPSRQEASSASSPTGDGRVVPTALSASSTSDTANQAQSKRAPAPHMFREIVAGENVTDVAALEDQVSAGIFLAGKTKKYCVDERTRHNCFMLFPRGLAITWSEDPKYWTWHPLKEGSDAEAGIETVALQNVCWLEVQGKLELSHLTPGVTYEVFFEVRLDDPAYGWSTPVNLRLKFPDGTIQQHKENLHEKPRGQWLQVKVGEVKPHKGQNGEAEISMFEYDGGQWKRGLLIKGIKITPQE